MRAILTYHSVDASGSPISIDEGAFRAQVAWLATGAVRVVPLDRIAAESGDAVALTFDDGFTNFAETAWPLLREHRFPVTLYVVTGRVGRDNDWKNQGARRVSTVPLFPLLGWDELGRLASEGVTIGAHTRSHPDLRGLDDARLADEIEGSAEDIAARTGARPASFAYPYGGVDDRAAAATRGFAQAVTTELRELGAEEAAHRLPRLDMYYLRDPGRLESWGTPAFRAHLKLRAGLRRVRALFTGRPA